MPRGRKPKPTHLKVLQGNPGHRPLNDMEPKPVGDLTEPPGWMSNSQKEIWQQAIANAPKGLLKKIDSSILEIWVVAYDAHKWAAQQLKSTGLLTRSSKNAIIASPLEGIMNRQAAKMLKAASELGFSPAARPRLKMETPPATTNPFLAYKRDA